MLTPLINRAKDLGFIAVGYSPPDTPPYFDRFTAWLSDSKHADMTWLERSREVRSAPMRLLEGCRTIISLAYPYPSQKVGTSDGFTVSRYAQPTTEDYHFRVKRLCRELAVIIGDMDEGSKVRICVDSAPILEKGFAWSGGIGFIGKNNMLIMPGYGSYFFLAEILTTTQLKQSKVETMENQCGNCTRCIDACPTGALEKPFYLDASKCLSYLTIEHKGPLDNTYGRHMGDCFFGCDLCQEVCPFNKEDVPAKVLLPSTDTFLRMDEDFFQEKYGKTAFARAGLDKIKENIRTMRTLG
jgi:epoxyqueuosine reductase